MGVMDDRGPALIGAISFFLALSWLIVLLRGYCRLILVRSFGLDDIFCFVAQILYTGYCACVRASVANGVGKHVANILPSDIPRGIMWGWISSPFYMFCNMALKLSIGIFLLRICVSKVQRAIIWCVMVVSAIICFCSCMVTLFQCSPMSYFWERASMTGGGSCINAEVVIAMTYTYTAMSCWSDWTYSIVPVFMVWNLQIHRQAKICVSLILGISSIASIITIIRIPSIGSLIGGDDFPYTVSDITLWSVCETGLALTACAAATLRPLGRRFSNNFETHDSSDIVMRSSRRTTQQDPWPTHARYSRKNGRLDDDEGGIQKGIGTHAVSIEGHANPLSRWPEDDQSSGAEVDRISNSSQAKLKMDTETGLVVPNSPPGITKTVVVTTESVKA